MRNHAFNPCRTAKSVPEMSLFVTTQPNNHFQNTTFHIVPRKKVAVVSKKKIISDTISQHQWKIMNICNHH